MTRDEAISIRQRQLCGEAIEPAMLAEAIETIKAAAHQQQPAPALAKPRGPQKSEATKAKLREAARADMESRVDRGNRLLLAKLRACMPWWDGAPTDPLDACATQAQAPQRAAVNTVEDQSLTPKRADAGSAPLDSQPAAAATAAALVLDHRRRTVRLVPVLHMELTQEIT